MADEKNRKGDKGPKSGKTKRTVGTVLGTGFFAVLSLIIIFPVFAGLLASFRPGTEPVSYTHLFIRRKRWRNS